MERLGAALESCGWRRRLPESAGKALKHASIYLFDHSVHYIHDEWPCDLDVHYNFPGFLAPDSVVFEALWARRTAIEIAHTRVVCADLLGQTAVVGLHALRDPRRTESQADIAFLAGNLRGGDDTYRGGLTELAVETGCSDTLLPLFEEVGERPVAGPWADPEKLRRWTVQTREAGIPTTAWLIELRLTPWWRRPGLVWRGLALPREELLSGHIGVKPTWQNVFRLHLQRWLRGARNLPRGVRAAHRTRRRGS